MKTYSANGLTLPVLGQGGWNIGNSVEKSKSEIAALRRGLELGMNLIDTAEMYGEGNSEILIAQALKGIKREEYLLVSKVYPHNAGRTRIFKSCEASLKRLKTDYLDLYLLHWRGSIPLEETVECMQELVERGKIRRWGVSNFDVADMDDLLKVPGGERCAVNQVLYHVASRGIEFDLIPWLRRHNMGVMAYCPLAQGGRLKRMGKDCLWDPILLSISKKYAISVMQLLLAFTLRVANLTSIPKAASLKHVEENAAVLNLDIAKEDWDAVDKAFWPPSSKMHLDIE